MEGRREQGRKGGWKGKEGRREQGREGREEEREGGRGEGERKGITGSVHTHLCKKSSYSTRHYFQV